MRPPELIIAQTDGSVDQLAEDDRFAQALLWQSDPPDDALDRLAPLAPLAARFFRGQSRCQRA
ncbi:MAG TPA: hypothetical protein VMZ31_07350 [Phycisphaerae bacterium]|nr:hypothetical protein [Phycisphaerae bacterium]